MGLMLLGGWPGQGSRGCPPSTSLRTGLTVSWLGGFCTFRRLASKSKLSKLLELFVPSPRDSGLTNYLTQPLKGWAFFCRP